MAEHPPLARSPIAPGRPVRVMAGWEVAAGRCAAALTLSDRTPVAKVVVRATAGEATAAALGTPPGTATRHDDGTLVAGSGPGEWTVLGPPGSGPALTARWQAVVDSGPDGGLVSAVDLTSAAVLMRITGAAAAALLAKVCAIDLDDGVTPDGAVFRSSVAKVVTTVIREDRGGTRSYLLSCDRSYGQYLFDALLDAGAEFGIEVDGYPEDGAW